MELSRQEQWNGLLFPTPGNLPNPGTEPTLLVSPALASGFFTTNTFCKRCMPLGRSFHLCAYSLTFRQSWGGDPQGPCGLWFKENKTQRGRKGGRLKSGPGRDFPGGLVIIKTSPSNAGSASSIPVRELRSHIPWGQKIKT